MYKLDRDVVDEMLQDDPSLGTLKNTFTTDEVWAMLEDKNEIQCEEDLYNALIAVMYATRPQGVL